MATITQAESLTEQFYRWEQRGRGWTVWDSPVDLEPPFVPFFFSAYRAGPNRNDDGRRPTFLSRLFEGFRQDEPEREQSEAPSADEAWYEAEAAPLGNLPPVCEFIVAPIGDGRLASEQMDQFLLSLSFCRFPLSFEILGSAKRIAVRMVCREPDHLHVEASLRAYFPDVSIERNDRSLEGISKRHGVAVDFGLSEEFMRPLRMFQHFDPDPLTAIVSALEGLRTGQTGLLQVLFQAVAQPWADSILRSVSDGAGGSFFDDAPEMPQLAREKTKRPLFACAVRALGASSSRDSAWDVVRRIAGTLLPVTAAPLSNELIPLANDGYDDAEHVEDVIRRRSRRSGMLLNSHELAGLVHPPSGAIASEKLSRRFSKTRAAPSFGSGTYVLGENAHRGVKTLVRLDTRQRLNHVHIIGATGTGKSTLLASLIVQDIEQGVGCAVIDPHGDLIERVMERVPERICPSVILFDPADPGNPNGINILSARTEAEKNVTISDFVSAVRRSSTSWGDQMSTVLSNAVHAFLESERGGTLFDLRRFLLEEEFREEFLKSVGDPEVVYFWQHQYRLLRGGTSSSILTRLDSFLRSKLVRRVIAPRVDLNFGGIMSRRQVLLAKLAQGLIGEENSTLLGNLIVSKLHQAALARQALRAEEREPFFLYIDEFHNFVTPSLAGVLSGARKYGLGLVLAHQDLRQIWNQDTAVANSVISNPGTRVSFRVGDFDARKLQDGFAHFSASDLQCLGVGEAIVKVDSANDDFNLLFSQPEAVPAEAARARSDLIFEANRRPEGAPVPAEAESPPPVRLESAPSEAVLPADRAPQESKEPLQERRPLRRERPTAPTADDEAALPQHRYLQTLIKRMAEDRGYRAVIEEPTPDGSGRVDVGLAGYGKRIACEIAVTTTDEHEMKNIEKCLAAAYDAVVVCSNEKKRLERLRALASKMFDSGDASKIHFLDPQELFTFLERPGPKPAVEEKRIKGYRVKVEYQDVHESERQHKRDAVAQVILQSMRRIKGNRK